MSEKKSKRDEMPTVAAFIDQLREQFGREGIDQMIRAGMQGKKNCFHARENGVEIGTPFDPVQREVR